MRRRELLTSNKRGEGRGMYNGYEYVDLQLTGSAASLMFATCNVGAAKEYNYGNYYKWGSGATTYDGTSTYNSAYFVVSSADTATQVMGGEWRMPTQAELEALTAQTTSTWTSIGGINGMKFSKTVDGKERYVFFPAAGVYTAKNSNSTIGEKGHYWSSNSYKNSTGSTACEMEFYSGMIYAYSGEYETKYHGESVRGVFTKKLPGRGTIDNYEYVDLGLPSGLKWATWNVGATAETAYGNYYQYGKGSSRYQVTSGQSNYSGTENPLALSADTARQVMKGSWRMPTSAECKELTANTTYKWEINFNGSGVNGGKFSKTVDGEERYVFFPAAGYYLSSSNSSKGSYSYVWSSTPYGTANAYHLVSYSSNNRNVNNLSRNHGCSVRGVHT